MRLNIEDRFFSEPRCSLFAKKLGIPKAEAIGVIVLLWHGSQAMKKHILDLETVCMLMYPEHDFEELNATSIANALLATRFIKEVDGGLYEIIGNKSQIEKSTANIEKAKKAASKRWGGNENSDLEKTADATSMPNASGSSIPKQCVSNAITNTNIRDTNVSLVGDSSDVKKPKKPKKKKEPKYSDWDFQIATQMRKAVLIKNPNADIPEKRLPQWSDDLRLLRKKHNPEIIEKVLDWTFKDSWWSSTVQSPRGLKNNWNQITAKMNSKKEMSLDAVANEAARRAAEPIDPNEIPF